MAIAATLTAVAISLIVWLVTHSSRLRLAMIGVVSIFAVLQLIGLLMFLFEDTGFDEETGSVTEYLRALALMLIPIVLGWVIIRAVRHRIVHSGDRPPELFIGALYRRGFWVRLAYLAGLPSSLWHGAAIKTPEFWAFLASRPMIYAGVLSLINPPTQLNLWQRLLLAAVLIVGGHIVFHAGKRLAARHIWNPRNPNDERAPVLFLRSFEDDQLRFKRSPWKLWERWVDLWSFRRNADEAMIDEVAQYGPVVALGMPEEQKVPFGANRYYSSHNDWQQIVTDTAKKAHAIVIAAGTTPGVLWEYNLLAREKLLDKTLLLFPPPNADRARPATALVAFSEATGNVVDVEICDNCCLIGLLQTDAGPTLITDHDVVSSAYVVAIRAHFQKSTAASLKDSLNI